MFQQQYCQSVLYLKVGKNIVETASQRNRISRDGTIKGKRHTVVYEAAVKPSHRSEIALTREGSTTGTPAKENWETARCSALRNRGKIK